MGNAVISFPGLGAWAVFDPVRFFSIFGLRIHFYGVFIALGLLLGGIYALRRAREFDLTQDNIYDFLFWSVPLAVVFSRIYFVLFSPDVGYFLRNPLRIFTDFRDGGVALYGAVIGAVLGAWICSRRKKLDLLSFLDVGAPALLIGQAVGRWGNFINREVFGRATDLPWRMGLTTATETIYVHPTFLYESIWNVIGLLLLHRYSKQPGRAYRGQIFLFYLGWYGLGRTWIELLREPAQNLFIFGTGIPISLLLAALSVVGAIVVNCVVLKRKRV